MHTQGKCNERKQKDMRDECHMLHMYLCVQIASSSFCCCCFWFLLFVFFLRKSFSIALYTVLKVALVDQAGLEPKEIHLPLPSEC